MTEDSAGRRPRAAGVRLRILGWYIALLVVAIISGVLMERKILLDRFDDEVELSLSQEAREIQALTAGRDPSTGQPFGADVAAIFDTFLRRNVPGEGEHYYTFVDGRPYAVDRDAPRLVDEDPELVARWATSTPARAASSRPRRGRLATPPSRSWSTARPEACSS